jgi:hypothetical protein
MADPDDPVSEATAFTAITRKLTMPKMKATIAAKIPILKRP